MNLIALNLPRHLSQDDLLVLFKSYGSVSSCHLVMNSDNVTSKGFGFIEMQHEDEAKAAIKGLHGMKFHKQAIRVKQAEER